MAQRILWHEDETILLMDVYEKIHQNEHYRSLLVRALSINLRRRARDLNIEIDDTFRNLAGINFRILEVEEIIQPSEKGIKNTSNLFRSTVDLYFNNKCVFQQKIERLDKYRVKIISDNVAFTQCETVVLLDGFLCMKEWNRTKAETSREISDKLRRLAIQYGYVFDDKYRSPGGIQGRLRKMGLAYSGVNILGEPVPKIFYETVSLYINQKSTFYEILQRANMVIENAEGKKLVNTAISEKNGKVSSFPFEYKSYSTQGDISMKKLSEREECFFSWLGKKIPHTQYERLFSSKDTVSMILLQHKLISASIFTYDDSEKLRNIIEDIPKNFASKKIRFDALQLVKLYISFLEENSIVEKEDAQTTSEELQMQFYDWLSQHELLAGPTCRSYVSALKSAECFASEKGYENCTLFTEDRDVAIETANTLLSDSIFKMEHSSYFPQLRRYLKYLGAEEKRVGVSVVERNDCKSIHNDLCVEIEEKVIEATNGISCTDLRSMFSQYDDRLYNEAILSADIILVIDKYYHKTNIEYFDDMANTIDDVIQRQFLQDGGYTSAYALYKEVVPKLDDFFFFNGAFESRAEIYDLAVYLFEKIGYNGRHYIFRKKIHIWEKRPDYPMEYGGLLINYGREHNNIFSRDEAIAYLDKHGSGTPAQTVSYILNHSGKENFLQYDENLFVLAEAINVDSLFVLRLQDQIEKLLEGDDYIPLGDIDEYFYTTLPSVPSNVTWGPLLLESILNHYDVGFETIDAGESNDMKTIDAALLRKNSIFKSFADIVWNEMKKDFVLPRSFTSEEFRNYLLSKGFLHGMERAYSVHKTVANDLRFYWTDSYSVVTVTNS